MNPTTVTPTEPDHVRRAEAVRVALAAHYATHRPVTVRRMRALVLTDAGIALADDMIVAAERRLAAQRARRKVRTRG